MSAFMEWAEPFLFIGVGLSVALILGVLFYSIIVSSKD